MKLREGRSFRPVEGDAGTGAAKVFTRSEADGSLLVALFNYDGSKGAEVKVELGRLGLEAGRMYRVTDLWEGDSREAQGVMEVALKPGASELLRLNAR